MLQEAPLLYGRGMKRRLALPAALLALAACDRSEPQPPTATVEDAWVRLPAVAGRPGALYFRAEGTARPTRIVGITSPRAERIELHETVREGGVARMVPLREDAFGPGEPLVFEPGGRHAMVFGLDPALEPGDAIPLTITFDPAPPVTIEAEARGPGGAGHSGH